MLSLEFASLFVSLLGLLASIVSVFVTVHVAEVQQVVRHSVAAVENRVQQIINGKTFAVGSPRNGDSVGAVESIRGITPFVGKHHYVVVEPQINGVDWLQRGQVTLEPGGGWSGSAEFGDSAASVGQKFIVRCMATHEELMPGRMRAVPEDAVFSPPVTVTRR